MARHDTSPEPPTAGPVELDRPGSVQGSPEPPPSQEVGAQSVWSNPENDPTKRESIADKPDEQATAKDAGAVKVPNWSDTAIPPPDRTPYSVDPTGASNAGDVGGGPNEHGFHVTVDEGATYTLAVDGVSTGELTDQSSLTDVETALNETSQSVGLDVSGTADDYNVSSDTAFTLTSEGATVEPWPGG